MKKILVIDNLPYFQALLSDELKSSEYEIDTISESCSLRESFEN